MDLKQLFDVTPRDPSPLAAAGIAPGLYHYMREADGSMIRFHLRADSTGDGLLLANAAAAAQLRPSGVIIAKAILDGDEEPAVVARLQKCFRGLSPEVAAADIRQVRKIIDELATPRDNYPIINLTDPAFLTRRAPLEKPLSADVPMGPIDAVRPILERLWDLGVPHVTFTAGKGPLAEDLVLAVERAEDLGLITGVRGRGSVLAKGALIGELAAAGLDHLDVTILSCDPDVHDGLTAAGDRAEAMEAIASARENEVCPVAEIALVRQTMTTIDETIEWLGGLEINNAAVFGIATAEAAAPGAPSTGEPIRAGDLPRAAHWIDEAADVYGLRLLCYPTLRFDPGRPLADQIAAGPRTSGDAAIRVEPGGAVIPPRGPYQSAGNLLQEEWATIRGGEVFQRYLRQLEPDPGDEGVGHLARAAFCPRDPSHWAEPTPP
jgi:hypothetical protein